MDEQVQTAQPATRSVQSSMTMQALLIAAAPMIASALGVDPDQLARGLDGAITLFGLGVAVYGRYRVGDLRLPFAKSP